MTAKKNQIKEEPVLTDYFANIHLQITNQKDANLFNKWITGKKQISFKKLRKLMGAKKNKLVVTQVESTGLAKGKLVNNQVALTLKPAIRKMK